MSRSTFLSFPLGSYISGLDDTSSEINSHLEGRVAEVLAESTSGSNGTLVGLTGGKNIWICLRNSSGGSLTCAGKGVRFSDGYWGRRVAGLVTDDGGYGLIADSTLTKSVPSGSFFWALKSGVTKAVLGGTVSAGNELCFDSSGRLVALDLTTGGSGGTQYSMLFQDGKAGGTAGATVRAASNMWNITVPAGTSGAKIVYHCPGLPVGALIVGFGLRGQIESAGNTATVDAELRKLTTAAADLVDSSVASMTQKVATSDSTLSSSDDKTGLSETVGSDEAFYVLVTVTTAAATDVDLQGAVIHYKTDAFNKTRRARMFALESGVAGDSKKVCVWDY